MSKNTPAFLFYPGDWLGGTLGMSFEEKGAYIELLVLQFNRGHMTSHMIGQTVGQLFGRIEDKFEKDEEGLWFNRRLDVEKEKRKAYVDSRTNNKSGKNQYSKEGGHMTYHMENENNIYSNTSSITPLPPEIVYRKFKHLSISQYELTKLIQAGYTKTQIDGILDAVENYKKNTGYVSLYLTALKWLKKEYPEVKELETQAQPMSHEEYEAYITGR